jgi:hypothetical protein
MVNLAHYAGQESPRISGPNNPWVAGLKRRK